MEQELINALKVLSEGGTILYHTDTIWGIGCDATNHAAVKKVYDIKKRQDNKSMLVLVDKPEMISRYVQEVPEIAWELMDVAIDPLTIIYSDAINLADNLIGNDNTIGIRVVNDEFCKNLIHKFKRPIVSTSANISGEPFPKNYAEINKEIISAVNYVVNWRKNEQSRTKPSEIIKVGKGRQFQIIRK